MPRVALPTPTRPGVCYAMDFVHDRLATGRQFKCLTMTDPWSKEVPVIEVDIPMEFTQHYQDRSQAVRKSTSLALV